VEGKGGRVFASRGGKKGGKEKTVGKAMQRLRDLHSKDNMKGGLGIGKDQHLFTGQIGSADETRKDTTNYFLRQEKRRPQGGKREG